ncbi:thioredoxin domain-containing protein [Polluticaenibacter yanchengensis]|uniref:Thioredoxin n=1 Tax=Polluticaenibacter yanchengensis TaxID=3014562 RepID=A0ABT4UGS6_9BACT|nr:hypothetical protein [Chitinophagaceae bacterium LY-5]
MSINFKDIALVTAIIPLLAGCSSSKKVAIPAPIPVENIKLFETYNTERDGKTLKGIITSEQIINDTAFNWYAANLKWFKADSVTVQEMRNKIGKNHYTIFAGTWCEDSHNILPKYLTLLKAANIPESDITLIAVDRNKTTIGGLEKAFGVTNVPTLILRQSSNEIGRIIEYGASSMPEKELLELLKKTP